jgi:putative oxidoreductase
MTSFLGRYADVFYAFLRIVAGWCFMLHGAQKMLGVLGGQKATEPLMQLAGTIELVGGFLILIGLFSSWAAFLASGMMAVAYWWKHAEAAEYLFPVLEGGGESAVLYCFIFLYIAARGAGPLSIASALGKPKLG